MGVAMTHLVFIAVGFGIKLQQSPCSLDLDELRVVPVALLVWHRRCSATMARCKVLQPPGRSNLVDSDDTK